MNADKITEVVKRQRDFFYSGKTLDVSYRIHALKKIKSFYFAA